MKYPAKHFETLKKTVFEILKHIKDDPENIPVFMLYGVATNQHNPFSSKNWLYLDNEGFIHYGHTLPENHGFNRLIEFEPDFYKETMQLKDAHIETAMNQILKQYKESKN